MFPIHYGMHSMLVEDITSNCSLCSIMQSTNHFKDPKHKGFDSNGRNLVYKISDEANFNNEVK